MAQFKINRRDARRQNEINSFVAAIEDNQSQVDIVELLLANTSEFTEQFNIDAEILTLATEQPVANETTTVDALRNIYCAKTGQIIAHRTDKQMAMLREIELRTRGISLDADYIAQSNQIADHWLDTSPEKLSALMRIDPNGFFVYAVSEAFIYAAPGYNPAKQSWMTHAARHAWINEKIILHSRLELLARDPINCAKIEQCNFAWVDYLRYIHRRTHLHRITFAQEKLSDFGRAADIDALANHLLSIITSVAHSIAGANLKYELPNVLQQMRGHSNFTKVHFNRLESEEEYATRFLRALGWNDDETNEAEIAKTYTGKRSTRDIKRAAVRKAEEARQSVASSALNPTFTGLNIKAAPKLTLDEEIAKIEAEEAAAANPPAKPQFAKFTFAIKRN